MNRFPESARRPRRAGTCAFPAQYNLRGPRGSGCAGLVLALLLRPARGNERSTEKPHLAFLFLSWLLFSCKNVAFCFQRKLWTVGRSHALEWHGPTGGPSSGSQMLTLPEQTQRSEVPCPVGMMLTLRATEGTLWVGVAPGAGSGRRADRTQRLCVGLLGPSRLPHTTKKGISSRDTGRQEAQTSLPLDRRGGARAGLPGALVNPPHYRLTPFCTCSPALRWPWGDTDVACVLRGSRRREGL